jgi:hypothetical protein
MSAVTLHLRFTQGHGWFVIERNPAVTFASTGTNERVIDGPYLRREQAICKRQKIADVFDLGSDLAGEWAHTNDDNPSIVEARS